LKINTVLVMSWNLTTQEVPLKRSV
jgi:hypothetical protein